MKLKMLAILLIVSLCIWVCIGASYYHLTYDRDLHNCKHSSIATHDMLADHGIESYYAVAIRTQSEGHVWIVVDTGIINIPFETISCGVPIPHYLLKYPSPDYTFDTTEEMLAFEKMYFNVS